MSKWQWENWNCVSGLWCLPNVAVRALIRDYWYCCSLLMFIGYEVWFKVYKHKWKILHWHQWTLEWVYVWFPSVQCCTLKECINIVPTKERTEATKGELSFIIKMDKFCTCREHMKGEESHYSFQTETKTKDTSCVIILASCCAFSSSSSSSFVVLLYSCYHSPVLPHSLLYDSASLLSKCLMLVPYHIFFLLHLSFIINR